MNNLNTEFPWQRFILIDIWLASVLKAFLPFGKWFEKLISHR